MQSLGDTLEALLPVAGRSSPERGIWEYPSDHPTTPRKLAVVLRDDGDVQVEFHIAGVQGSPYEQMFVVFNEPVELAARAIAAFVADLLAEERILAVNAGFLAGGQCFVAPGEREARTARWLASFRGTYDRNLPPGAAA